MIELIVVLAVVGLLLSIAVPRYVDSMDRGKAQVQRANLAAMREAIDKYYGDRGKYPENLDDLVQKRYLRFIPPDPFTDRPDWGVIAPPDAPTGGVYDVQPAGGAGASAAARAASAQ